MQKAGEADHLALPGPGIAEIELACSCRPFGLRGLDRILHFRARPARCHRDGVAFGAKRPGRRGKNEEKSKRRQARTRNHNKTLKISADPRWADAIEMEQRCQSAARFLSNSHKVRRSWAAWPAGY